MTRIFESHSEEETINFGCNLAQKLKGGECICLHGELGSGKTCFTKGIAKGLGVSSAYTVTSPTFTLVNEYPGRLGLIHVDCYRLGDPYELWELGLMDRLSIDRVMVIEWAEKMKQYLPQSLLNIFIEVKGDLRYFKLVSVGQAFHELLQDM